MNEKSERNGVVESIMSILFLIVKAFRYDKKNTYHAEEGASVFPQGHPPTADHPRANSGMHIELRSCQQQVIKIHG